MSDLNHRNDHTANPAPLGLLGFGMTTVLLNFHNIGWFPLNSMILAMGVCYGGVAQVIAGIMEWKKGNTFGTVAFTSYGFFWLTLVALILLPQTGMTPATPESGMAAFFALWGIFTAAMFIATLRMAFIMRAVFGSLSMLFALLALRDYLASPAIGHAAGWIGLACGGFAIYAALAQILNEVFGAVVLPLGEVRA